MVRFKGFFPVSRRGVHAVAAAISLSVAACSDDATAPHVAEAPAAIELTDVQSDLTIRKFVVATFMISDIFVNPITEKPTAVFKWGTDSLVVKDNAASDLDPALGKFKVVLPPGAPMYTACARGMTEHYIATTYMSNYPICTSWPAVGYKVDLGGVVMRRMPTFSFKMQDLSGGTIVGGVVQIEFAGWQQEIEDGEVGWDQDGLKNGKIDFYMSAPGALGWCELVPPNGFQQTVPACGSIDLQYDKHFDVVLKHTRVALQLPG